MKTTLNERIIAYLALISGLAISAVAVYYSVVGLTSIFAAATIPIIIMGTTLEISKLIATIWLKQNWDTAPRAIKAYLVSAIIVLMLITSMGIFGFLSKAHLDQSLVSGDVIAKIAIYDEKIKTAKENIDANRKALKQMDEAVDQVMARSTSETGADKAVAVRRSQQKERGRLLAEIETYQKTVSSLNEERAPIAAEIRKVEAEVGPIKYIAAFFYDSTDQAILEKAVTWVIMTLIVVFDPLAVILLLASQISFQKFKEREDPNERELQEFADAFNEVFAEGDSPNKDPDNIVEGQPTVTNSILESHPYLFKPFNHFTATTPIVHKPEPAYEADDGPLTNEQINQIVISAPIPIEIREESKLVRTKIFPTPEPEIPYTILEEYHDPDYLESPSVENTATGLTPETPTVALHTSGDYVDINGQTYHKTAVPAGLQSYVQNEEQRQSNLWTTTISQEQYLQASQEKFESSDEDTSADVNDRQSKP